MQKILTLVFFCLYLVVLFIGVFAELDINSSVVSFKFDFVGTWCSKTINFTFSNITTFDLVINLVMLIPVGMFVFYLSINKKPMTKIILLLAFGLLAGVFIETLQFILPIQRSVQFSDAILNMISTLIGGLIAWDYLWVISKLRKKN
ncbi:MAG: VanZ family protein [Clostridia bacterium]|nr:VanZ family protein [Clostridia bacterium]